jgi:hypothetical protein
MGVSLSAGCNLSRADVRVVPKRALVRTMTSNSQRYIILIALGDQSFVARLQRTTQQEVGSGVLPDQSVRCLSNTPWLLQNGRPQ